jgi:hypothetical protein
VLTPDRIKPLLLHEDRFVRDAASEYFADFWSRDPDLVPLIVQAYRTHRTPEDLSGLSRCDQLAIDERGLESLLACLSETEDAKAIAHVNQALGVLPPELAAGQMERLRSGKNVEPDTLARLDRRALLAARTAEDLWAELQTFARQSDESEDVDLTYANDLTDLLASRAVPDDDTMVRLLTGPEEGWLELFLIELAGARGCRPAVPALVEKLKIDADYVLGETPVALARIGDPQAATLVRAAFPGAEEHYRWYAPGVFEKLKHEESERAALELLEHEKDRTIRTMLCLALCRLFSERGIPVVLQEIDRGSDESMVDLRAELLPVADVLGVPLPLADHWRTRREEEQRRLQKRIAEMEAEVASGGPLWGGPLAGEPPEETWAPQEPYRREEERVGRNDPCPCGSGKKFKKCCGRS